MDQTLLDYSWVDLLQRTAGYGGFRQSTMESLIGLNNHGYGGIIPHNDDFIGLGLFTRPRLNLSYNNLSSNRLMTPLLTDHKMSYQAYIRQILDPEYTKKNPDLATPLLDPKQAFIPLLSNSLISANGWPDITSGTFTATQGVFREEWSMIDDTTKIFNTFDITCNFRNIQGDPVSALFMHWVTYMSDVYTGDMLPFDDSIWENEKDYETAFYRLVLSPDWDYVNKIARTIMFPWTVPMGAIFNYDNEKPRAGDLDQISIQFRAQGAEYSDPILFEEFNGVVSDFNGDMLKLKKTSEGYRDPTGKLLLISKEDRKYLNFYGYPHIDPLNGKLDWFIDKTVYAALSGDAGKLAVVRPGQNLNAGLE